MATKHELAQRLLELSSAFTGLPQTADSSAIVTEYSETLDAYIRLNVDGIH